MYIHSAHLFLNSPNVYYQLWAKCLWQLLRLIIWKIERLALLCPLPCVLNYSTNVSRNRGSSLLNTCTSKVTVEDVGNGATVRLWLNGPDELFYSGFTLAVQTDMKDKFSPHDAEKYWWTFVNQTLQSLCWIIQHHSVCWT